VSFVADYFRVNRARNRKAFVAIYSPLFFGWLFVRLLQGPTSSPVRVVIDWLVGSLFLAVGVTALIGLLCLLDAYLSVARRARHTGISIGQYLKSDDYARHVEIIFSRPLEPKDR
jgi:hypothetical protein